MVKSCLLILHFFLFLSQRLDKLRKRYRCSCVILKSFSFPFLEICYEVIGNDIKAISQIPDSHCREKVQEKTRFNVFS